MEHRKMESDRITKTDRAEQIYDRFRDRASKDDEFHDWEGYRGKLTDFVIRNTSRGGSLLILGAGKCNDLDLRKLAEHCGSITLSDYRPETAEEAFQSYGLSPSEHVRFEAADYVGIPDAAYLEYTRLLLAAMRKLTGGPGRSLEETAGEELSGLRQGLEQIYRENSSYEIDLGKRRFDHAVIAGVHSQLNNSFRGIFQYVLKATEEQEGPVSFAEELNKAVFEITREHTADLVHRFNEAVFAVTRESVIYGYEKSILYTPRGSKAPVIGTVDGARQAGEAVEALPAEDRLSCLWPLSRRRNIKFEMEILCVPVREDF